MAQSNAQTGSDEPDGTTAEQSSVDPLILEILVCPLTKTRLKYDADAQELISTAAGLAYPIKDGVPMMTMEAARQLSETNR